MADLSQTYISEQGMNNLQQSLYEFDKIDDKIFYMTAEGLTAEEIGKKIFISKSTVEDRIDKAKKIMNANNKTHLLIKLLKQKKIFLSKIAIVLLFFIIQYPLNNCFAQNCLAGGRITAATIGIDTCWPNCSVAERIEVLLYSQDSSCFPATVLILVWNDDDSTIYVFRNQNLADTIRITKDGAECNGEILFWGWKARYSATVDLPPNTLGWTATVQGCCRENGYVNIVNGQGWTYFIHIPPISQIDFSPIFWWL